MENFVVDILKQAPAVAALVFVVLRFLAHIRESELSREKVEQTRLAALQTLGDTCHEAQASIASRSEAVISRVTQAMDRNTEVLGRTTATLDRVEDLVDTVAALHAQAASLRAPRRGAPTSHFPPVPPSSAEGK